MRLAVSATLILTLAACATVPDSNPDAAGVGFGNRAAYLEDQRRRDAALAGQAVAGLDGAVSSENGTAGAPLSVLRTDPGTPTAVASGGEAGSIAADTRAALGVTQAPPPGTPRLSDEQNFEAVANRETIESDRARLEQQRAEFEVVQPTDLPDRPQSGLGPNIVQYALSTSHPRGQAVYRRTNLFGARDGRNCNRYTNANEAQERFLERGGPDRDPEGLDPDGDGYACGWDPAPFRLAAGGGN